MTNQSGPRMIQVLDFATARAPELHALHELAHHTDVYNEVDAKTISQKDRRRRRANAFHSYQVPRRHRLRPNSGHVEMKENEAKIENNRCRKHRRRPHLLYQSRKFNQPQHSVSKADDVVNIEDVSDHEAFSDANNGLKVQEDAKKVTKKPYWLSTHVWHAKRMRMKENFGYILPQHRSDKSISAALTALRKSAIIHDVSYYGVLEILGTCMQIKEILRHITDPLCNDFSDDQGVSTLHEGKTMLYHTGSFPYSPIGPATYMWTPKADDDGNAMISDEHQQLWLWLHPAIFQEVYEEIIDIVNQSELDDKVCVSDLRGQLCRFRLRGTQSSTMIKNFISKLKVPIPIECDQTVEFMNHDAAEPNDDTKPNKINIGIAKYLHQCLDYALSKNVHSQTAVNQSANIYSLILQDPRKMATRFSNTPTNKSLLIEPSINEVPNNNIACPVTGESLLSDENKGQNTNLDEPDPSRILGVLNSILELSTVNNISADPLETKISSDKNASDIQPTNNGIDSENRQDIVHRSVLSFLWKSQCRTRLLDTFEPDHIVNTRVFTKSKTKWKLQQRLSSENSHSLQIWEMLHTLIVHRGREYSKNCKYAGEEWDLIIPSAFAPTVLQLFVFLGALVVGLDEDEACNTVWHQLSFPRDFPDTYAGKMFWYERNEANMAKYHRKPKAKRFAYMKHGFSSPFQPDWSLLWQSTKLKNKTKDNDVELCVIRGQRYMEPFCFYTKNQVNPDDPKFIAKPFIPMAIKSLVGVYLSFPRRGSPEANSILYVPHEDEINSFLSNGKWNGTYVTNNSTHESLGIITSAYYDRPKGTFRAIGFCDCEKLQQMFQSQSSMKLIDKTGTTSAVFALFRAPTSKMYRTTRLSILE